MKRVLALVFLLLLLLTGCAGTPQSRESGATAVVSVLGVEPAGQGIHLLAAAEGRGEEEPFRCDSQGETPAAAVEGRSCSVMPFRSPSRARKPSCGWSGRIPWRRPFPGRRTPPSG